METNEAQSLFSREVYGNYLLQLNDGKLLFYYFNKKYDIYIYTEKLFQELFGIYLHNFIYHFENEKIDNQLKNKEVNGAEDEDEDLKNYYDAIYYVDNNKNKNSIKELNDGSILIGRDYYLFELNLHEKTYDCKVINDHY